MSSIQKTDQACFTAPRPTLGDCLVNLWLSECVWICLKHSTDRWWLNLRLNSTLGVNKRTTALFDAFYGGIEINKYSVRSSVVRTSLSFVTNTKYPWIKYSL